jgi:hypothetical protein
MERGARLNEGGGRENSTSINYEMESRSYPRHIKSNAPKNIVYNNNETKTL